MNSIKLVCLFFISIILTFSHQLVLFIFFRWIILFKKIPLAKNNFSSYIAVVSLISMIFTVNANALTAVTINKINGSKPYLTFDKGKTKVISTEGLLSVTLPDGRQYVSSGDMAHLYPNAIVNDSTMTNPIILNKGELDFVNIKTFVPLKKEGNSNYPSVALNSLIKLYNYWGDDDGDGNVTATGSLTLSWINKQGQNVTSMISNNTITALDPCDAPYQLNIQTTDGLLSTQYGIPNTTRFNAATSVYYITPKIDMPYVCYAQPNFSMDQSYGPNWVSKKGFRVDNIDNVANNFPTTGSNGLHFYLLLAGITPNQVIAANGATVFPENGNKTVNLSLTVEQTQNWNGQPQLALKILLNGPTQDSTNKSFTPSEFKLYSDNNHSQLLYNFKIERWYITKIEQANGYENAKAFCNNLGATYRIPGVEDFTNGNGYGWENGIPGQGNSYRRQISYKNGDKWVGGLMNEWGYLSNTSTDYPAAKNWDGSGIYWTSLAVPNMYGLIYDINNGMYSQGYIGYNMPSTLTHRVVCVSP